MHQVLLAIEKGVKTIILFLSEYLTGKGLDYIISPPPPINVLEQRVTEAQGRTPLPQAMKEWDPKSLAPSEVLTALFEARYYASQLESSDEEIQAIAKEKILDLDISSISQELIDQGVLAVQKEIDRLLLDDPVIFQLKAQKDIYESYVADLNILKEALIHNQSAMLALAEQTAGREVDMLQRITGYTWDGSVDGYNYLVTQGKNEIDKIDPTVSDEMKEYREQMENAYIAVQGLFANEHFFEFMHYSDELKTSIQAREEDLETERPNYERIKEQIDPYYSSHPHLFQDGSDADKAVVSEISDSIESLLNGLLEQEDTAAEDIHALEEMVTILTGTSADLQSLSDSLNAAIQNIPNTIATMAPIYPVCSCGAGSTAGVSDGVSGETFVEDIVSGVVTGVGRMEVKVNEQVFGEMVDRRNNQNLKNALAGRGFSWI